MQEAHVVSSLYSFNLTVPFVSLLEENNMYYYFSFLFSVKINNRVFFFLIMTIEIFSLTKINEVSQTMMD